MLQLELRHVQEERRTVNEVHPSHLQLFSSVLGERGVESFSLQSQLVKLSFTTSSGWRDVKVVTSRRETRTKKVEENLKAAEKCRPPHKGWGGGLHHDITT